MKLTANSPTGSITMARPSPRAQMHAQIRRNQPCKYPICAMALVKATSGGEGDSTSVMIDTVARRLVGIETGTAKVGLVSQTIRTIGLIDDDESKLASMSAYVGGRIEKLYMNYVGVPVKKNDDLALTYSPDLHLAKVEYLTAQSGGLKRLGGSSDFAELAKQKLIELGLTDDQIKDLHHVEKQRAEFDFVHRF